MKIIELTQVQREEIDEKLYEYDRTFMKKEMNGGVHIGIEVDGRLVAGLDAVMTSFRILYLSTLFVDEEYRGMGLGRTPVEEMERRAAELGADTIRLDTFSWQGKDFYSAMGYQIVGHYENQEDGYEEYFFLKRIGSER
ncbi:GNAT family N-acetyltransferase [Filifactor villosus]|uniref:GNAT family N-acetyltransferase n=1 Tax=Filifactor villosus TaxID=29374 RepID=A0ABV9QMJ6_9FIRM